MGQYEDSLGKDHPAIARVVTKNQLAAQRGHEQPGVIFQRQGMTLAQSIMAEGTFPFVPTTKDRFLGKVLTHGGVLTGWSATSASISSVVTPPDGPQAYRQSASSAMQIASSASAGSATITSVTAPVAVGSQRVDFWLYVPDYTKITSIILYLATSGAFTDYWTKTFTPYHNGWACFTADLTTNITGAPTAETITAVRITINAVSAAGAAIIFDRLTIGAGGKTKCAFVFDDGNNSDYTHAVPLLNKYGLIGNFALIHDLADPSYFNMLSWSGHRMIVHGGVSLGSFASIQEVESEVQINRAFVESLDGPSVDSDVYIYPYGVYLTPSNTMEIPELLESMGFVGAFTIGASRIPPEYGLNRFALRRQEIKATTVAATLLSTVDAWIAGGWCGCFMVHKVVESGATGYDINRSVFDDILAGIRTRINSGLLDVVTAKELIMHVAPTRD